MALASQRGKTWDVALWAGPKTPLHGTAQAHAAESMPPSAASMAVVEVLESPPGLIAALSAHKAYAAAATAEQSDGKQAVDPAARAAAAAAAFALTEIEVITPGNFASAEMYCPFVLNRRARYPTRGILVIGHAGIQAQDQNGRIRFFLHEYANITAQFYHAVILTDLCARILTPPEADPPAASGAGAGEHHPAPARRHRRKPKLIAAAHSVGAYILTLALDQVTQVPHWDEHVALSEVQMYAPVLQNFEKAPAGEGTRQFINPVAAGAIAYGAALPLWLLPDGVKDGMLAKITGATPQFAHQLVDIMRPASTFNCLGLVHDAYAVILDLDDKTTGVAPFLAALGPKLKIYFCFHDGWVPPHYIALLKEKVPLCSIIVEGEAHKEVSHSCCVTHPDHTAGVF